MTTIKLKGGKKQKATLFIAGNFFKTKSGALCILTRIASEELGLVKIDKDDSFLSYGKDRFISPQMATLDTINKVFGADLTPISVTISED